MPKAPGKVVMPKRKASVVRLVKEKAGGPRALARALGIAHQNISYWRRIPVHFVLKIEELYGIPRELQRPDVYPPNDYRRA